MKTLVKICGIRDLETAIAVANFGADAIGFVFAESKRKISKEDAREIIRNLPKKILKIGVFVDETKENLLDIYEYCSLDFVQLHGEEDPKFCEELGIPYIKAFSVGDFNDAKDAEKFNAYGYLFDAPRGKYIGGNGVTFDWKVLEGLSPKVTKKLILAGGLNSLNVKEAIDNVKPYMVDVSSGVETDGVKDIEKIEEFIKKAKV